MTTLTLYTGLLLVAVSATAATAGSTDVATGNSRLPADVADDTHDERTKNETMYVVSSMYDSNASRWTMETYDGETRKWTVHKLPEEAWGSRAAAVDGQLYLMGGGNPATSRVWRYDPTTDTWETQPDMTGYNRAWNCVAVLNNTIYSMGSYDNNYYNYNYAERRDPATGEWSPVSSMTTGHYGCGAAALNGFVYVVGGYDRGTILRTMERYDPATDRWTQCANMSTERLRHGVAALGGYIYAMGGDQDDGYPSSSVERYDPETDTWTPVADLPVTRDDLAAAAVGGRLMAVGGFYLDRNRTDSYDPASDQWTRGPDMNLPRDWPGVAVIG